MKQIKLYHIVKIQSATFKPICDELRALGYEILEGVK